ncbi:hypothetical protein Pmani_005040 [Petrolisthes manimaculis]|uniref:RRM domain-containing protein n=1 Tax=Petrolisthes manimaculis TaxID=1843537 RepID=A0AAE1QDL5_9EUCA|nr:hypothetical protein Pmani_005040 [Petrolisthes manimaculis]
MFGAQTSTRAITSPIFSSNTQVFSSTTPTFSSASPAFSSTTPLSSSGTFLPSSVNSVSSGTTPVFSTPVSSFATPSPVFSNQASVLSGKTYATSSTSPIFSNATSLVVSNTMSLAFSRTAPVFSMTPALSSTSMGFRKPIVSSTSLTTVASTGTTVFPSTLKEVKNFQENPSATFGDSRKGQETTFIPNALTGVQATSEYNVSTDNVKPSNTRNQANPFFSLPSSSVASSTSSSSTGAHVFGRSLTHTTPKPPVFGGITMNSNNELSSEKDKKAPFSTSSDLTYSSQRTEAEASSVTSASTPFTAQLFNARKNEGVQIKTSQSASSNIFGGPAKSTIPSVFGGGGGVGPTALGNSSQAKGFSEGGNPKLPTSVSSVVSEEVGSSVSSRGKKAASVGSSFTSPRRDGTVNTRIAPSAKVSLFSAGGKTKVSDSHDLKHSPVASPPKRTSTSPIEGSPQDESKKLLTKVMVSNIPESCMTKDILRTHFAKYGEVKRITITAKSSQATIQYTTHAEASRAKKKGKKIHPKLPEVKIYYATPARRKSEDGSNEAMISKKKAIKTLQHAHQLSDIDPYIPIQRPGLEPTPTENHPTRLKPVSSSRSAPISQELKKAGKRKQLSALSTAPTDSKDSIIDREDVKALLTSRALSNNDRYLILKARDKCIRNKFQRTFDLKKATYLSATCPDMCPELERYMRDVQYDLSSFEMTDGVLDHRLVTKRFSRSSADKEEPLPHELRPGPVLLKTMDFLICNVINRGDEKGMEVDVWYNYLWNRTRAVRNDLMQQQLTDEVAVVIMERCTRFHIYAAARLCEEPPDLFDTKMNTEHLTKSLQTLKELYHDLAERGEYFDTEAEFRAYEMLLNLSDGETIVTQYSKFREDVQKSCSVQFALKVILAVMFNNYSKFFKLVRQASYLQGCLLHRYFRQIRVRGLDTMIKAYKNKQFVPLSTIRNILGFEDDDDATAFLKCHGLNVEGEGIVLDKHSFISHPDELPVMVRPLKLVEVKRISSVSEVIFGGSLPNNPLLIHIPHNSFDDQGYLKSEAKDASDQQQFLKAVKAPEIIPVPIPSVTKHDPHQNYQLLAHMKDVYQMIESIVIGEMSSQICREVIEKSRVDEEVVQKLSNEVMEESLVKEVKQLSTEGYLEVEKEERERQRKRKEEEERERKIMEEIQKDVAINIHASYIEHGVKEQLREVCQEAMGEINFEFQTAMKDLREEIPQSCLEEVLLEETLDISRSAMDAMSEEQEQMISDFKEMIDLRKMKEIFCLWQTQAQRSRLRKRSQETFPASCSQLSLKQQNESLGWGYERKSSYNMTALQMAKLQSDFSLCLEKVKVKNQLRRELALLPLSLQTRMEEEVDKISPKSSNIIKQYFKVVVCWTSSTSPTLKQWLRNKLNDNGKENLDNSLHNCIKVTSRKNGVEYAWALTESSVDELSLQTSLQGASLILFISSNMGISDPQFQKFTRMMARYPKVLCGHIFYECRNRTGEGWNLIEEDLLKPEVSEKLQELLFDSWKQYNKSIEVVCSRLNSFVSGFVAKQFVHPVLQAHSERTTDGKSPMFPVTLIGLFNAVIKFLGRIINSEDVSKLDWPPPELSNMSQIPSPNWNKADVLCVLHLLNGLELPELHVEGVTTWKNITNIVISYGMQAGCQKGNSTVLVSHLQAILNNTRRILEPIFGYQDVNFVDCEIHVLQLPWTELIYACVSHKLSELPDIPVYYKPGSLERFTFPQLWWSAYDTSDAQWAQVMREPEMLGSRKRKAEREEVLRNDQSKVQKLPSKLLSDIQEAQQKSAQFERKLESLLEIDIDLKSLFP